MAGTHGDLFSEIGKLVVDAHDGEPINLKQVSEEMAARYINLGVSSEMIERAIARSMGAVGVSLALVRAGDRIAAKANAEQIDVPSADGSPAVADVPKLPSKLFPS